MLDNTALPALGAQRVPDPPELTDEDLSNLERLYAATTPGEWRPVDDAEYGDFGSILYKYLAGVDSIDGTHSIQIFEYSDDWNDEMLQNAEFIAAAHDAVPRLIRALREVRAILEGYREAWSTPRD